MQATTLGTVPWRRSGEHAPLPSSGSHTGLVGAGPVVTRGAATQTRPLTVRVEGEARGAGCCGPAVAYGPFPVSCLEVRVGFPVCTLSVSLGCRYLPGTLCRPSRDPRLTPTVRCSRFSFWKLTLFFWSIFCPKFQCQSRVLVTLRRWPRGFPRAMHQCPLLSASYLRSTLVPTEALASRPPRDLLRFPLPAPGLRPGHHVASERHISPGSS